MRTTAAICLFAALLLAGPATAEFDPYLNEKAARYQEWLETWHAGSLGGVPPSASFTTEAREELDCYHGTGDSMIWTGMYLGSQSLRYMATGDEDALSEILRIVTYMHNAMDITDTPGYLPRYAGLDEPPFNCGYPDTHGWKNHGTGEWEGYFWVDHTSRDQYNGYWWGMGLAYDSLSGGSKDEQQAREWIRHDLTAIVDMLLDNKWNITDQNGEYTGNGAAWVGFVNRLSWLVTILHVTGDPFYRELLDEQYEKNVLFLGSDTSSFFNRYKEYFGNNLRHLNYQAIFRYWPDRHRFEHLWEIWQRENRPHVKRTHNPWYDAVHISGCLRLGYCDTAEYDWIAADSYRGLTVFWEVPNYRRKVTPPELPLDPFSVWLDDLYENNPGLPDIFDINPQTSQAHQVEDRCWDDMIWQRSPFSISCGGGENKKYVDAGFQFLVPYWMGVYYGILPGDGPYGDDDFEEDGPPDEGDWDDDDAPASDDNDDSFDGGGDDVEGQTSTSGDDGRCGE